MKKVLLVAVVLLLAAPVFAQGPFTDVPTDHWAYDAVNQLQKDGILIGYPDGTFAGKRTITRFEFAVALARVMGATPDAGGLTKADVEGMLSEYAKKSEIPTIPTLNNLATKDDVAAIKKLVDEFRDEIAALGVDVDALKRDVAALGARVDALEAMVKRVVWTGDVTVFGIAGGSTTGTAIDLDARELANPQTGTVLFRNISFVKDMDLKVVGRVSENTTANATINYGNYLNYLAFVDDYVDGPRPTSKQPNPNAPFGLRADQDTLSDAFFPYYLYINTGLGKGDLTAGRFPLQFTPYTLKMIDVDSYTNILKTSDGNYPMDGAKLAWNFGGVDVTLFAAKNDENDYLINGLTGQPNGGLYNLNSPTTFSAPFHQAGGNAVGGLNQVTQTAGARFTVGTPCNGVLGATFYQAWDNSGWNQAAGILPAWDQARVYGADLSIPIPLFDNKLTFGGSYTRSDTIGSFTPASAFNIDDDNIAWDARIGFGIGSVEGGAGYKNIERNFAAAGAWDKIGRWTNPTDVAGPYAEFAYPFSNNLKIMLNGEYLRGIDDIQQGGALIFAKGDRVLKAEGAVKWGFMKNSSLDVSYQWVNFRPSDVVATPNNASNESYLTVGLGHQVCPTANVSVGYQFISYNGDPVLRPYYNDYRGGLGVIQLGVSF